MYAVIEFCNNGDPNDVTHFPRRGMADHYIKCAKNFARRNFGYGPLYSKPIYVKPATKSKWNARPSMDPVYYADEDIPF